MKKLKVLPIVVLIAILTLSLAGCKQVGLEEGNYSVIYDLPAPTMKLNSDGEFNIFQLNDLHLVGGNSSKDKKTLAEIDNVLKAKDYELVVLAGDVFEGLNSNTYDKASALKNLVAVFEENQQAFCYVAGNNDGELLGSNESIILAFSKSEYFKVSDTKDVGGTGNYYIKILDANDKEVHRLLIMDSRMRDDKGKYHSIDDSQVKYYNKVAQECKDLGVKLSLFMHITFDSAITAINSGESFAGDDNFIGIKDLWEDNGNGNRALYSAVKDSDVCGLISAGHLHNIDVVKFYDGIIFKVVRSAGYFTQLKEGNKHGGAEIAIMPSKTAVKEMYKFNTVLFK